MPDRVQSSDDSSQQEKAKTGKTTDKKDKKDKHKKDEKKNKKDNKKNKKDKKTKGKKHGDDEDEEGPDCDNVPLGGGDDDDDGDDFSDLDGMETLLEPDAGSSKKDPDTKKRPAARNDGPKKRPSRKAAEDVEACVFVSKCFKCENSYVEYVGTCWSYIYACMSASDGAGTKTFRVHD